MSFGRVTLDLLPDDPAQAKASMEEQRKVLETGVPRRVENSVVIADSTYYYETVLVRRADSDGRVMGVAGYCRNVTERKLAEEALRELNSSLEAKVAERTELLRHQSQVMQSILTSMGDAVLVADQSGKFLLHNPALERMSGPRWATTLAETNNQPRLFKADRKTPYSVEELPLSRAIRGQRVNDEQLIFRHENGDEIWASVTATPLLDEEGCPGGGVAVSRDITERKRADEALRFSEERFRLLVEQSPLSVQILSPGGVTLRVNKAFERLFGVNLEQLADYNLLHDPQLKDVGADVPDSAGICRQACLCAASALPPRSRGIHRHGSLGVRLCISSDRSGWSGPRSGSCP